MKRMKRILSCALALLLALLPLIPQPAFAYNEYPNTVAPIYYTRPINPKDIPAGTLLIGTHLIYRPVIYDRLYEMAIASASESGQTSVYYKSELAGGTWFEIGTATSIADITTTGAAVPDSVIAKLVSTHHTKADGLTYLTLNGADPYWGERGYVDTAAQACKPKDFQINIYTHQKSINAIEDLPEFVSFTTAFGVIINQNATWDIVIQTRRDLSNGWEDVLSRHKYQMDQLESLRYMLIREGASAQEWGIVAQLMEDIDNKRRIAYFQKCDTILDKTSRDAYRVAPEEPPEMLLMTVANTQKALRASIAKLQGKVMTSGNSTMEYLRFQKYSELDYFTSQFNYMWMYQDTVRGIVRDLVNIENIMASNIVNREAELMMLNYQLVPTTSTYYKTALSLQTNADYDAAAKIPAAVALRERVVNENVGKVNVKQTELEQLILERVDRSSKEDSIAFINARITEANTFYGMIKDGPFRKGAVASLDAHIEFLKRLLKSLTGEESPTEQLQKEKTKLQDALMQALDENKTDEADGIRDKIDAVDTKITALDEGNAYELALLEEEIKKTEGELKDAPEEETEELAKKLAEAKDKLSDIKIGTTDDSLIKVVEDLKKDGGDAIDRGDTGAVDVVLDSLISVAEQDPRVVVPAIKDIHDKMVDKGDGSGFKDQIAKAEDGIRKNANAVTEATKPKTEREIELIVGEYDPAEDKRNAAVVAALGQYVYTEAGRGMEDLWKSWLDKLLADNNPYVFVRYNDGDNEYIPYDVLGYFAGMRPVWYQNQQIGTLSKGGDYYSFKVDSTKVGRDKDSTKNDEMTITAKWQTVVHVHESYTKLKFDCEAFYIPNSIYGVLVSPEIKVMLDEILGKMEDAGKTI